MNSYVWAHLIHLFCAIAFVGSVFFETLILSALHNKQKVSSEARREAGRAIMKRAIRIMPFVVLTLYASGLHMAFSRYADVLKSPLSSSLGTLLLIKIALAGSVFGHFAFAVINMWRGRLSGKASHFIHLSVALHMIAIVLLAKLMFYWAW